jgi:hypothetical protein
MRRARAAKPKMFPLVRLAAIAIKSFVGVAHQRFRHEQLAFVKRPEWNSTARIRALLQHA